MKLTSQSTRQKTSFANIGMENNSKPMEQKNDNFNHDRSAAFVQ